MNGLVGTAKTISYHQGHADGMREAVKAVKAIKEFSKRNYLDTPQRLIDFMSGVLEECERQLRYMNGAKEETEEN